MKQTRNKQERGAAAFTPTATPPLSNDEIALCAVIARIVARSMNDRQQTQRGKP